ncbi:hypothetical protein [Vibrio sp. B1FLJ16]|uniref:hypothetical protein n=1 Tax=Vibrio sp. B1FLJ16 TaxID=2751178 RepID=UPI0015F72C8D|nr:hypothetical protein [Vibrio sp. B1FLJ16]CAD7819967.1 hypothetical protein ACOMICROBIO_EPCKBFOG_03771 [Vibrio sp. B1FLJ16]CAD7821271.1 hypothetical protein ACOMICROBIO_FLGHMIGD_04330 [Vibrio sp. B1FLJ16]CAE6941298.1 hypothetical protein ACOMICROBIO_EPCKBFOG_03771 [Vibrio sp. B1FLJ16]CAE6945665.1 hypothetical protein ACOMICROBIO_FLGHMIGD_04330 [Vibrio sp. B1FLJ16]
MFNKIGYTALSIVCLLPQVGCMTTGIQPITSSTTNENVIRSESEQQIMKQATVAGTIGGVAVSAILINKYGEDWPLALQLAAGIGGTIAAQQIAQYIAMVQISNLRDVTLDNDKKEALLAEARKVNYEYAQLNAELKASIKANKGNKEALETDLAKAQMNKKNSELVLQDRKLMLDMLVKDSEQYNEYAEEIARLEKEDAALASVITELNSQGVGGV